MTDEHGLDVEEPAWSGWQEFRWQVMRPFWRARGRTLDLWAFWRDRSAQSVAVVEVAQKPVLDDEPRLRAMLDGVLRDKVQRVTPLGWRRADLRWALGNARRALRGEPMVTALPYEERVAIDVTDQHPDFFTRNAVAIRMERRRVPVVRRR